MTEQPSAEWQSLANTEPYRIGQYVRFRPNCHDRWFVFDMRPEDEPTIGPDYRTREEAAAAAAALNAALPTRRERAAALLTDAEITGILDANEMEP
jgi:hypothetical protein